MEKDQVKLTLPPAARAPAHSSLPSVALGKHFAYALGKVPDSSSGVITKTKFQNPSARRCPRAHAPIGISC